MRIKRVTMDNSGLSYVWTAVIILVIAMVFSVVLQFASMMTILETTKENTQRVLDSFIIENAVEIFGSVKSGNNETLGNDYNDRMKALITEELKLTASGSILYGANGDDELIFSYANPLTASINDDVLELKTDFEIIIPVSFAGNTLFDMRVPLQVKSLYVMKEGQ